MDVRLVELRQSCDQGVEYASLVTTMQARGENSHVLL
ncbi:hypothetical protein DEV91_10396 [Phyllobacterium brassicacearum]|nr:hypothetical protein DEV91_10396 [Phyllobacterium brassicacearum]